MLRKNAVGLFIVLIMVLGGVGLFYGDNVDTRQEYNNHKFVLQNDMWYTKINDDYIGFNFHPMDLENLDVDEDAFSKLADVRMVYITFDPESEIVSSFEVARMQLEQELGKYAGIFPVIGVTSNSSEYWAYPVIDCLNATSDIPVLVFSQANKTRISEYNNCIQLTAFDSFDAPALRDRLMLGILGIM